MAAPAAASAPQVSTKRKEPEPTPDYANQDMILYLRGEGRPTVETAEEDDKDREVAERILATWDEQLAWISAKEAELGITPRPELLAEIERDLGWYDEDTGFSILKPQDYGEGKRRLGNDGLLRYYDCTM